MGNNSGEALNIATRMMEGMETGQYWRSNSESLAGMWTSDSPWGGMCKGSELFVKLQQQAWGGLAPPEESDPDSQYHWRSS